MVLVSKCKAGLHTIEDEQESDSCSKCRYQQKLKLWFKQITNDIQNGTFKDTAQPLDKLCNELMKSLFDKVVQDINTGILTKKDNKDE